MPQDDCKFSCPYVIELVVTYFLEILREAHYPTTKLPLEVRNRLLQRTSLPAICTRVIWLLMVAGLARGLISARLTEACEPACIAVQALQPCVLCSVPLVQFVSTGPSNSSVYKAV